MVKVFLEVLGAATGDSAAGLLLFFDEARYLFECGDGTQRFCTEYSVRLSRLRAIHLSSLAAPSFGGLLGMMLTMADAGKNEVDIIGPVGTRSLIGAARGFFHRPAMKTRLIEVNDDCDNEKRREYWEREDENLTIKAVAIDEDGKWVSYVVTLRDIPGKFNPEKALALGVKKGKDFGTLVKGGVVEVYDGRTITRDDVMSKSTPGPVIVVAACPYVDLVDSFIAKQELSPISIGVQPCTVVKEDSFDARDCVIAHFVPKEVLTDGRYLKWANSYGPNCTHILLHDSYSVNRPVFRSQSTGLSVLNKAVDHQYFPLPCNTPFCAEQDLCRGGVPTTLPNDDILKDIELVGTWVLGDIGLRYTLAPVANRGMDSDAVPPLDVWSPNREKVVWSVDYDQKVEMSPPDCVSSFTEKTAELKMLGTAAAIPGKYRNVSGVLLNMFDRGGVLFDCGEGTWGQLVRAYGREQCSRIVKELRLVFISHMHADHHLGLPTLLHYRESIGYAPAGEDNDEAKPLIIIGPCLLRDWLDSVIALVEPLSFTFVDSATLSDPQSPKTHVFAETMGFDIACVPVIHCPFSYGIILRDRVVDWKIVYSGDTRPCDALAEAGAGATVAIHEATFEDNMKDEAVYRLHSTYSEALDLCANRMGAWRTILTHFSQRYARVPKLDEATMRNLCQGRATVAFDHMTINFSRLVELPAVTSAVREVLAEEVALLCSSSDQ